MKTAPQLFTTGHLAFSEAISQGHQTEVALLKAVATMLAESRSRTAAPAGKLPYTENNVISSMNYDLCVTTPGKLNEVISRIKHEPGDLDNFKLWFTAVHYPWAKINDVDITYQMVCRKYPEWLQRARKYASRKQAAEGPQVNKWR